MRQYVYEKMPVAQLKENFDKIVSAGYSVSLFTDWQSDFINEVWIKCLEHDFGILRSARFLWRQSCHQKLASHC